MKNVHEYIDVDSPSNLNKLCKIQAKIINMSSMEEKTNK
jgi:hypothetical protein